MTSDMALPRWLEHRSTILCSRAMGIRLVLGNPRTALLRAQAARWRPALALKCADAKLKKKQPLFLLDGRDGFAGVFDLGQRAHGDRSRVADALTQLRANLINVLHTPGLGVGNATRDSGIERGEVRERERFHRVASFPGQDFLDGRGLSLLENALLLEDMIEAAAHVGISGRAHCITSFMTSSSPPTSTRARHD